MGGHPPALEAAQHALPGQPLATPVGVQQHFGQGRGIEETEVHALPGQRVDGMCAASPINARPSAT